MTRHDLKYEYLEFEKKDYNYSETLQNGISDIPVPSRNFTEQYTLSLTQKNLISTTSDNTSSNTNTNTSESTTVTKNSSVKTTPSTITQTSKKGFCIIL